MAPHWLVRLNDVLAWFNPALAGIAALLALMVIAAAAERFPANATRATALSARAASVVVSAECPRVVLPPKWRDLQLYD